MAIPMVEPDVLSPSLIEAAKRRARVAIQQGKNLKAEAEAVAARSTEMVEANHLTEHLSKLFSRSE